MGGGFSQMKKQAKMMQEQMLKMQEELKDKIVDGKAANGLVKVIINGEKEIKEIKIDPSCIDPNDVEGLQDLIIAALKDAYEKVNADDHSSSLNNLLPFQL